MSDILGYVVIEWNQASHRPNVLDGSFSDTREWAETVAADERARLVASGSGRLERYTVAEVIEVEGSDE